MDVFPAFFPLIGRVVVIAGVGEAAETKARLFNGSPARVVRIEGAAAHDAASYAGAVLAFVAGGERAFLAGAAAAARAAGVPVNVVDHLDLCDFTTPALIDRGEVVAAVGSAGAAPMLAALLRNDIEARVPQGAGRVAALLRGLQAEIRAALPALPARRAFLRAALAGPAAEAALAGEMARAQSLLPRGARRSGGGRGSVGRVCVIAAVGDIDLLSLRAARRLAEADVLVFGAAVSPGLVGLARRDARRLTLEAAELASLAAVGLVVVGSPPPTTAALAALRDAGVVVEILASAPAAP